MNVSTMVLVSNVTIGPDRSDLVMTVLRIQAMVVFNHRSILMHMYASTEEYCRTSCHDQFEFHDVKLAGSHGFEP